jgi:hypothetical protein
MIARRQETAALRNLNPAYVRFGSTADFKASLADVRFTPKSGQRADILVCPLCAMCGRLRVGKAFFTFAGWSVQPCDREVGDMASAIDDMAS